MTDQLWWYVARAGGIVGWILLTAGVVLGLVLSTKTARRRLRPAWVLDLHRFIGGLALIFVGVHVLALVADSYTRFGLLEVLVPFTGAWHPAAVAGGVIGLYLLAAVELTSLLRARLPNRLWRRVHVLSFPAFLLTTLHALLAGTDSHSPVATAVLLASTAAVTAFAFVRVDQVARAEDARTAGTRARATMMEV